MIVIDPKTAIINKDAFLLEEVLKKAGYENIIGVSANAIREQGGNLRCLYAPLLRKRPAESE